MIGCPSASVKTPYGCQCTAANSFYDTLLTFKCVNSNIVFYLACPLGTIGINGVCMQCPFNCEKCQRDEFHRQFLECVTCAPEYTLFQAQCVKTCNNNKGLSTVNGTCVPCSDKNCVNCSGDAKVCLKCSLLFSLASNGTCISTSCLI